MSGRDACPSCRRPWRVDDIPPEPPVGTWVKDRHGATSYHQVQGGWGVPGIVPFGRWQAMWKARGPLVECGPWGRPTPPADPEDGHEAWVADVLDEHFDPPGWMRSDDDRFAYECECGERMLTEPWRAVVEPPDVEDAAEWHRAHVATILAARIAEAEAAAAERIAVAIEGLPLENAYSGHWIDGFESAKIRAARIARAESEARDV